MIRKTLVGIAAAATVAIAMAAGAPTASADTKVQFSFGFPGFVPGPVYHAPYYGYGYGVPVVTYHSCPKVIVGYKKVHTHHGWKTRPIYRRHCY